MFAKGAVPGDARGLVVAYGASVGEGPAVAIVLAVLVALFNLAPPAPDTPGAHGAAGGGGDGGGGGGGGGVPPSPGARAMAAAAASGGECGVNGQGGGADGCTSIAPLLQLVLRAESWAVEDCAAECATRAGAAGGALPAGAAVRPAVSKEAIDERLIWLQALRANPGASASQLALPRALVKQVNRFFMSQPLRRPESPSAASAAASRITYGRGPGWSGQ